MTMLRLFLAISFAALITTPASLQTLSKGEKLLVLLLDGLRFDYFEEPKLSLLPNFKKIIQSGSRAEHTVPTFPSYSYPNYYSIMTGLYTESHGMTGNRMWDERTNTTFAWTGVELSQDGYRPSWWEHAEPLWVRAVRHNIPTYMYMWPHCEIPVFGVNVTDCLKYEFPQSADLDLLQKRLTKAVDDLAENTSFAAVYSEEPDHTSHEYGPDTTHTLTKMIEIDVIMGHVLRHIRSRNLEDALNVIVLSDHGQRTVPRNSTTIVTHGQWNPADCVNVFSSSSLWQLWPKPGKEDKVRADFQKMSSHITVYRRSEIPERFHMKKGVYVSPLLITVNAGYILSKDALVPSPYGAYEGVHGYDTLDETSQRGVFAAMGPAFRKNHTVPGFENLNAYNVMCHVLGIEPAPNNGTWAAVKGMLSDDGTGSFSEASFLSTNVLFCVPLCLVYIFFNCLFGKIIHY